MTESEMLQIMAQEEADGKRANVVPRKPRPTVVDLTPRPFWTSLDLKSERGKRLYMRAKRAVDHDAGDFLNQTFKLTDVLIHQASEVDPATGEERTWTRYCLFTDEDKIISGGSDTVREALADLCVLEGPPPWTDGIAVKLVSIKTANKRTMHSLEKV